jgi:hypothetical protein
MHQTVQLLETVKQTTRHDLQSWTKVELNLSCPEIALHKSKQYEVQIYQKGRQAF